MSDIHTILFETKAYAEGLRNLAVESDGTLSYLTAFQFDMLLRPISEALDQALAALEQERPAVKDPSIRLLNGTRSLKP
jgi:hypothetical protein